MIVFRAEAAFFFFFVTRHEELAETGWETCLNLGYRSMWVSAVKLIFFCR